MGSEELIGTLQNVKHTATEVKQRLDKALETSKNITLSRLKYERVNFYSNSMLRHYLSLLAVCLHYILQQK